MRTYEGSKRSCTCIARSVVPASCCDRFRDVSLQKSHRVAYRCLIAELRSVSIASTHHCSLLDVVSFYATRVCIGQFIIIVVIVGVRFNIIFIVTSCVYHYSSLFGTMPPL